MCRGYTSHASTPLCIGAAAHLCEHVRLNQEFSSRSQPESGNANIVLQVELIAQCQHDGVLLDLSAMKGIVILIKVDFRMLPVLVNV